MPSKIRARRWPENLKGKLICIRVPREVKAALYAKIREKGKKPCTELSKRIVKWSGVKIA